MWGGDVDGGDDCGSGVTWDTGITDCVIMYRVMHSFAAIPSMANASAGSNVTTIADADAESVAHIKAQKTAGNGCSSAQPPHHSSILHHTLPTRVSASARVRMQVRLTQLWPNMLDMIHTISF